MILFLDCPFPHWVNDGFCDQLTSVAECDFDGEDCNEQINETMSTNQIEEQSTETIDQDSQCYEPFWVGDGYCDDQTNNENCDYDGGDCCLSFVQEDYCSFCECHELESETTTPEISLSTTSLTSCQINFAAEIGNQLCNDYLNKEICNYDGGDCCLPDKGILCQECVCLAPIETTTLKFCTASGMYCWTVLPG